MQRYRNHAGNSGVIAYEAGPDSITVVFADGATYLYTEASAGRAVIHRMKTLARAGRGLATFIVRHARDAYANRLR